MTNRGNEIGEALARIECDARQLADLARAKRSGPGDALAPAYRLHDLRAVRDESLPANLFGDPAWDLLLGLFIANAQQREVTTTALFDHANLPPATGTRWLNPLEVEGLVAKNSCPDGRRVRLYRLTERAQRSPRHVLASF